MAKKGEVTGKKVKEVVATAEAAGVVTIKDLAEEFGIEGAKIRAHLRAKGYKAPEIEQVGFGPKARYEWAADSKELVEIRKTLSELNQE